MDVRDHRIELRRLEHLAPRRHAFLEHAIGHDLVDLLVGSEGSLAFFTAVEVALIPVAAATASVFAAFDDLGRAVEAAVASRAGGASACELLDRTFLRIASRAGTPLPAPEGTEAVLLVEIEGRDASEAMDIANRMRA